VEVIRKMAPEYPHQQIALTLNRKALRRGSGLGWTTRRVADIRKKHQNPEFRPMEVSTSDVTLQDATIHLQVCTSTLRRLVPEGILPARQIVKCAPWRIPMTPASEAVQRALTSMPSRRVYRIFVDVRQQHMFSDR
jgi:hypothetical protein